MFNLINFLLPLAIEMVRKYINSSESRYDDKVLEVVKDGAEYLVCKNNNTLSKFETTGIKVATMKKEVK